MIEASNAGVTDGQLSTELPDIQLKERVAAVNKLLSAVGHPVTSDLLCDCVIFMSHIVLKNAEGHSNKAILKNIPDRIIF